MAQVARAQTEVPPALTRGAVLVLAAVYTALAVLILSPLGRVDYAAAWAQTRLTDLVLVSPDGAAVAVVRDITPEDCRALRDAELTSAWQQRRAVPPLACAPQWAWWRRVARFLWLVGAAADATQAPTTAPRS